MGCWLGEITKTMNKSFRILMIAPTSFFSDYGGHIRILEETRTLQAMGHQVRIVTYYKGDDLPELDIRRTPPLPWRTEYEVGSSRHKIAFDVYLAVQALWEAVRMRPDVIHGHMHEGALIGGVLSRLLRVPLVFDFQGSLSGEMVDHGFLDVNGRFYSLVHRLEKMINSWPQAILTSSIRAQRQLQEDFAVPASQIHPLPDCADPQRFDPTLFTEPAKAQLKAQLGVPPDKTVIAYLGLMTEYQGTGHLVETAVRLRHQNVHFLVMGYPNVEHYRTLAEAKGVAHMMTFTGKVEYRNAPYFLSLGDIAVAPKMSTTEGSGKLLNYMAMAQPIVAYQTQVHQEYLADLGIYAPVGDVDAFADALLQLLQQPERQHQLGQKLRQRALTVYSWQTACQQIVDLYKRLTSKV